MDERELLARTMSLLDAERAAIRKLDIEAVDRIATEKEALFDQLKATLSRKRPGDGEGKQELGAVIEAAKHNCLLLAHARDLTRSAVALVTPEPRSEAPHPPNAYKPARRGVRLSVTG